MSIDNEFMHWLTLRTEPTDRTPTTTEAQLMCEAFHAAWQLGRLAERTNRTQMQGTEMIPKAELTNDAWYYGSLHLPNVKAQWTSKHNVFWCWIDPPDVTPRYVERPNETPVGFLPLVQVPSR